jgi:predicted nucleotidyltransferase
MTVANKFLPEELKRSLAQLALQHGARNMRVFGSVARGESRPDSDIDLLIDMEPGRSLFDFVAFWQDAEELLGRRVDVVTEAGLNPYLRRRILEEAIPL